VSVYFGVDIGGTRVKAALVNETGEILYKTAFDTMPERGLTDLSQRLRHVMSAGAEEIDLNPAEVLGVGVGVPAFLDVSSGVIIEAVNLGWSNLPFKSALEQVFERPVRIENDANVAALGESFAGAGRNHRNVLCATVGTGVGGGIVLNGEVYRGSNGMAGEIGHLVVDREHGTRCNCGRHGCLETVASATAIVRAAKKLQEKGALPAQIDITGAQSVFELAQNGDQSAQMVVENAAHWLGYGLALAAVTLNPDAIVIGGGVSKAGAFLLDPVRESFQTYALPRVVEGAALMLAELGNDAGVVGAARLIGQRLSE
jgi:glucokinase